MSNYDDMRDMQMREQYGDDYIAPTIAYTGEDYAELVHDCGGDEDSANSIMNQVMEKDMERYASQLAARLQNRISFLESLLEDNGIDYECFD